jgi:hypothetical protein
MIFCKELNKEFATKQEMFLALKANKDKIIGLKKAAIKDSDPVLFYPRESRESTKAVELTKAVNTGDDIYPIINTTNWLDSHGDVHLDGIWDMSVKDQNGKVYYLINHDLKIGSVISYPNEVEPYVQTMNWTDLGKDIPGTTQALVFKTKLTEKANADASKAIKDGIPLQNSIRMQYVKMDLAVDSNEKGLEMEYANFYKHLPNIANKEDAQAAGYFWAISEAKIIKEGSAVLAGSNSMTPIFYTDPAGAGQKEQQSPSADSLVKTNTRHLLL